MKKMLLLAIILAPLILLGCGRQEDKQLEEFVCPPKDQWTNCMPILSTEEAAYCQSVKSSCPEAKIAY